MAKAANGTNGWLVRILLIAALALLSGGGLAAVKRNETVHDKIIERVRITEKGLAVMKVTVDRIDENVERLLERN